MKNKSLATWLGTGAIALSLAVLPSTLPASAQTTTDPVTPGDTGTTTTTTDPVTPGDTGTTTTTTADDGFDWGWLGLIGLAGLAGLKGRDRDDKRATATYTTDRTTTPRL